MYKNLGATAFSGSSKPNVKRRESILGKTSLLCFTSGCTTVQYHSQDDATCSLTFIKKLSVPIIITTYT